MESLLQVSTTPATPAVQYVILVAFDETPLRDPYDQGHTTNPIQPWGVKHFKPMPLLPPCSQQSCILRYHIGFLNCLALVESLRTHYTYISHS